MKQKETIETEIPALSRRRFVQGLFVAGVVGGMGSSLSALQGEVFQKSPALLTGNRFDLEIDSKFVNITGKPSRATLVNGSLPAPTMKWREGDLVTLAVTNRLKKPTSIHWHGIRVPFEMDGVPGLSFAGIAPGETFVYRIPVRQSGTYWYHSHSGDQELTGVSGALIIEPMQEESLKYDREYVIFLTDWTDTNPDTVFRNLKQDSEYYNYGQRTAGTFLKDAKKNGLRPTIFNRRMWGGMNMTPTDISDVTGATYTYLLNGSAPATNWTGLFSSGERVRLRFINGSSMTFFDVRIPGLSMTVVQTDGNDVEPVTVDEFRIGNAETYDVIVEPDSNIAYTIFAQAMDRSGYARGTLAPAMGMTAAVPHLDPRPLRTMVDMGMAMSSMKMPNMKMPSTSSSGAAMHDMSGMDMGSMGTAMDSCPASKSGKEPMEGMSMGLEKRNMPFPQPGPHTKAIEEDSAPMEKLVSMPAKKMHIGPQIDGLSMAVRERLNDPGDGLQGNGRRVLTYSDLRARYRGVDHRPPTREIELHLTGNMERYIWGFDGKKFTDTGPIEVKLGERVRFVFINDSMMDHPIHLHGLWSELETGKGDFNPYKHTVIVKPSERVSYLVSADTPGRWALHCHLLFHMRSGMFRTVVVA